MPIALSHRREAVTSRETASRNFGIVREQSHTYPSGFVMPSTAPASLDQLVVEQVTRMLLQKGQAWVRLRTFFVYCQEESLYKAATALGLSGVTPVRGRLKTLQRDLGLTLIVAECNGTHLTKDGIALLKLLTPEFGEGSRVRPDTCPK
jgi:hypothetical protein